MTSALGDVTWELAKRLRTPAEVEEGSVWGGYINEAQVWIHRIFKAEETDQAHVTTQMQGNRWSENDPLERLVRDVGLALMRRRLVSRGASKAWLRNDAIAILKALSSDTARQDLIALWEKK